MKITPKGLRGPDVYTGACISAALAQKGKTIARCLRVMFCLCSRAGGLEGRRLRVARLEHASISANPSDSPSTPSIQWPEKWG